MNTFSIGIDFGHGESAAAFPEKRSDKPYVMRLMMDGSNNPVIPTQIVLTNEQMRQIKGQKLGQIEGQKWLRYDFLKKIGPFQIGKTSYYVPDGERFLYFKVAPKDFHKPCGTTAVAKECGITHGMVMACYIYSVVENILTYNKDLLAGFERGVAELLIGCPTTDDWTAPQNRTEYMQLVEQATGVSSVRIIPESRAAMFSSVENNDNNISAIDGAIVFDFGSSTADCTYMLLGRKILEFSWTLGAYIVERMMTRLALEETVKGKPFNPDREQMLDAADRMRDVKEAYYDGKYPPEGEPMTCKFLNADTGKPEYAMVVVGKDFMERVTGNCKATILCDSVNSRIGSWRGLCRDFFQEAKRQIEASTYTDEQGKMQRCTVKTVVITGGASKMDFIEALCKEIFPNCTVILNKTNPSHTVSNGLAWIAITDSNLPSCKEAALNQVMSRDLPSALTNKLTDTVFVKISQIIASQVTAWVNQPGDTATLAELENTLNTAMQSDKVKDYIKALCSKDIQKWKTNLEAEIERAIHMQTKKLYSEKTAASLMLPRNLWKEFDGSNMDITFDLSNLLNGINFDTLIPECLYDILDFLTLGISSWLIDLFGPADPKNAPRSQLKRQSIANKITSRIELEKNVLMSPFTENLTRQAAGLENAIAPTIDKALSIVTLQQFEL